MEECTREGRGGRRATEKLIWFGAFNIQNGQNGGLESSLCRMEQGWVDCGVFKEKKITKGVYTH